MKTINELNKIFDECIKSAMAIGRKYMSSAKNPNKPTEEEWALALILFEKEIR